MGWLFGWRGVVSFWSASPLWCRHADMSLSLLCSTQQHTMLALNMVVALLCLTQQHLTHHLHHPTVNQGNMQVGTLNWHVALVFRSVFSEVSKQGLGTATWPRADTLQKTQNTKLYENRAEYEHYGVNFFFSYSAGCCRVFFVFLYSAGSATTAF